IVYNRDACTWTIMGEAVDVRRTAERQAIVTVLREANDPLTPSDIAAAAGMKVTVVKVLLGKLLKEGAVGKVGYGSDCALKVEPGDAPPSPSPVDAMRE